MCIGALPINQLYVAADINFPAAHNHTVSHSLTCRLMSASTVCSGAAAGVKGLVPGQHSGADEGCVSAPLSLFPPRFNLFV